MTEMTHLPVLQSVKAYGIRPDIHGNCKFINNEDVVYPIGGALAFHNIFQKRVKYVKLPNKGVNVNLMTLSPARNLIAIAEKGDRPSVTLYDVLSYKKRKQFVIPPDKEVNSRYFVSVTFTFDARNIICCTGPPDYMFYVFNCLKNKLESFARGNNLNGTGTVNEIACNPNDINLLAVVGLNVIKLMACSDTIWRQFGYSKTENINFTSAVWLSQDRLLCGSFTGRIAVIEGGELKQVFFVNDLLVMDFKATDEEEKAASETSLHETTMVGSSFGEGSPIDLRVRCMCVFARGLVFEYQSGRVHFFEKETNHRYRKRNLYIVPDNFVPHEKDERTVLSTVNSLDINPSQDHLLVTCLQKQMFTVRLWGPDLNANPEIKVYELGPELHHGAVGCLDICLWKPIFVTTGEWDRKVKIWNFETDILELTKQYQEDLYGVALHPTGLYMILGFSGKLRYMVILIDDLVCKKEYGIRYCKLMSFSNRGHLFAAVNGNVVQIISSISFENIINLKGHSGWITGMSWCKNDSKLVTCGTEGAVYEWDLSTGKRVSEVILKNCIFTGVSFISSGKGNYSVSQDGVIRENGEWTVSRERPLLESSLECVVLSQLDSMLFVTGNEGSIYSIKLPLQDDSAFVEFTMHCTSVVKMKMTHEDGHIISVSEDGDIFIWRVLNAETKAIKLEKELLSSTDVLIPREILQEKLNEIDFLHRRLEELQSEFYYQMRQTEATYSEKIRSIHEGYCTAIQELKEKNQMMEMDHSREVAKIFQDIDAVKKKHDEEMTALETSYNEKLIAEYDKYQVLEDSKTLMRSRYEEELEQLRQNKKSSEEELTNYYLQLLNEKKAEVEELIEEGNRKVKEHEMIKQQIEDDADREIYELKSSHEKVLREEQDANMKLKGETGIIRKKLLATHKEMEELKHNVVLLENDQARFKSTILNLDKDISDLKLEIAERDITIQDKESRILDLKSRNMELEKFKFILEFKIEELKAQIEPRDKKIEEQADQINDMVGELENLQKVIISLDLQLVELREKLAAADRELQREEKKSRASKALLKTIRSDIHRASGYTQDIPKLVREIKNMYHKYNADKDFEQTQAEDCEATNEFLRQRNFLEKTVNTLKKQIKLGQITRGSDKYRLVNENAELVGDTSSLRHQLKVEQRKCRNFESLLGLSSKYMLPSEAQKRLQAAVATREEIRDEFKSKLTESENRITLLRSENCRLLKKIVKEQGQGGEEVSTSAPSAKDTSST